MSYFPNKKGLVSGFVQIGMFFTSTFLILLAEMAINPKGLNPTISVGEDIFFEEIIAKEIKTYILYFFIYSAYLISGILSILLIISATVSTISVVFEFYLQNKIDNAEITNENVTQYANLLN